MSDDNNVGDSWKQNHVAHCPKDKCKGMLLQSDWYHFEKCSKCGAKFITITEYKEIQDERR